MFHFTKGSAADEDRLTGAVFGLLRYLPTPEFLHPLLELLAEQIEDSEGGKGRPGLWNVEKPPEEVRVEPWPPLEVPEEMRGILEDEGSEVKGTLEPDAHVLIRWPGPTYTSIFVEAEYSKVVEASQLAEQWAALQRSPYKDHRLFLLLVNRTQGLPRVDRTSLKSMDTGERSSLEEWVEERARKLLPTRAEEGGSTQLLHVSWTDIAELVRRLERSSWAYRPLFDGLLAYLEVGGVTILPRLEEVVMGGREILRDRRRLHRFARWDLGDANRSKPPGKLFNEVKEHWFPKG